ncbi:rRNA maturation RNase YbeY [Pigmentiphaga litoralis]|uniref:Endoribonuclease YbeY n=1 Tax=Pigmentiphaga litoralis TaxID=516702 RepID=A0A7Y9ITP8_9BURK|nr:rRNA maturation RNase YbeY [Pigmentiphaga litoralis]NYE23711.1 putative rRNA maturation factor [Pigmentiphaga litoralis]NYE82675.1 putative rRNA maturation factor [Pigmentiphaga litoralis]
MTEASPTVTPLSLSVQYAVDDDRLPRWRVRRWVALTLKHLRTSKSAPTAVHLTLRIVGAAEGRRLNRDFRERDYATNVLTFEYGDDPSGTTSGDIVLCLPVLVKEAREQKKPFLNHAAHLVIHGVLHALGYDHLNAREATRMERLETRILAELAIPDPYRVS